MEIQYTYTKKRKEFGSPCFFSSVGPNLLVDIAHDEKLVEEYTQLLRRNKEIQCVHSMAEHEVNTVSSKKESRGMNHKVGGWPADTNPADEDQVARFRKKVEKLETYTETMMSLADSMEHCVKQNIALDIYEPYFGDEEKGEFIPSARTVNVFSDFNPMKRNISRLCWSSGSSNRFGVVYSPDYLYSSQYVSIECYVWDIENCYKPAFTLKPDSKLICMEFNPKDHNTIVAGCENGQLLIWDLRKGSRPTLSTPIEYSHKDIVYDVKWLPSKSSTECVSGSADCQILWWDIRKLGKPIDKFALDPGETESPLLDQKHGAMSLEYDPTMPDLFLVGTAQGSLFSCHRNSETLHKTIILLHRGNHRVYNVQRNPLYKKNFMTVGAWVARIWDEDITISPVLSMWNRDSFITDGCWSSTRPSVAFLSKTNGELEIWDMLFKQDGPILINMVDEAGIACLKVNEHGNLIVCGGDSGSVHLLQPSPGLTLMKENDDILLGKLFEREIVRKVNGADWNFKTKMSEDNVKASNEIVRDAVQVITEVENQIEKEEAEDNSKAAEDIAHDTVEQVITEVEKQIEKAEAEGSNKISDEILFDTVEQLITKVNDQIKKEGAEDNNETSDEIICDIVEQIITEVRREMVEDNSKTSDDIA